MAQRLRIGTALDPPDHWEDIATRAGEQGPPRLGLKNAFLEVFRPADYRGYQEEKLNARIQAEDEELLGFYFAVLNLCNKVDPDMPEVKKVDHLLRCVKRKLGKELMPYEVETCDEFLRRAKLLQRAADVYNAPGRGKMVAAVSRNEKATAEEEGKPMKFAPGRNQENVAEEASSKALFEMQ